MISLWVLVDREHHPLAVKIQGVALAAEIRVLIKANEAYIMPPRWVSVVWSIKQAGKDMLFKFGVSSWSFYLKDQDGLHVRQAPSVDMVAGDVATVPAMLRRRLNDFGKLCAAQFLAHGSIAQQIPIVYSSRHGDIQRTTDVLVALAEGEAVSPMHFSLAVHNAILGVMSIHTGNESKVSAISFANEGFVPLLLEALGLLAQGHESVMCIISDAPLPDEYRGFQIEGESHFACSFIVSAAGEGYSLSYIGETDRIAPSSSMAQTQEVVALLDGKAKTAALTLNGSQWMVSS